MDADHFDSLSRSLVTRSRRGILSALAAAIGGAVIEDEALAKRKRAKQRKRGQDRARASDERVAAEKRKKKKKKKKGTNPAASVPPPADPCAGIVCAAVPSGTSGCVGGACVVTACDAGFRDCDGLLSTGCETEVQSNLQHCGTCGNVCPGQGEPNTTVTCVNGTCQKRRTNDVVISQLYTAGGTSSTATFTNDYVELFNRGTTPVALDGWSLQYSGPSDTVWTSVALAGSGTLPGGSYFLVKGAAGGSTTNNLPQPHYSNDTLSMNTSNGRLALVESATALTCGATAGCATAPGVIDFIGYGTTNSAEGNAPAPSPTNKNALFRLGGGCTDTNNNAADFTLAAAAPRTTATPAASCA